MSANKINLKDKVNDGEIDLSLCELQDVPVKEIASIRNIYSLDLSNNHLMKLPNNFGILIHLTKLDLSKNKLRKLPDEFGNLIKLKYLDLYKNDLQFLPITFYKLKALRWLDLKDNPLSPSMLSIAGTCLDAKECQKCAVEIVKFYSDFNDNLNTELARREAHRQQAKLVKEQAEQKQKVQEKKNKKKEKKSKTSTTVEELPISLNKKESINKTQNKNPPSKEHCCKSTLFCLLSFLLLFTIIFIVTTLKFPIMAQFNKHVVNLWDMCLQLLPQQINQQFIVFGQQFAKFHGRVGAQITYLINFISDFFINSDNEVILKIKSCCLEIPNNIVHYKNYLYEQFKYFYTKFIL